MKQFQNPKSIWILGRGGFLGTALAGTAAQAGYEVFPQVSIPWNSPDQRQSVIAATCDEFILFARDTRAHIVWVAGSEGVGSTSSLGTSEVDSFLDLVEALTAAKGLYGTSITVVSSAGGVYSGSPSPPFNSQSPIGAINEYGRNKILIEQSASTELVSNYLVHIARVTNLYGPWPGLRQGLINRLCTAAATRESIQIYVPLDTVRDYIYVTDAAKLLLLEMDFAKGLHDRTSQSVSVIGSGENNSVGSVINTIAHVTHRKIPYTMAQLASSALQPKDLRMYPSWIERGIEFEPLSLAQGVKRLFDSLVTVPRWY